MQRGKWVPWRPRILNSPWHGSTRSPPLCKLACMKCSESQASFPRGSVSTRLSRKVLRPIAGRPMVEWVWRAASASGLMDPVIVATDAEEVAGVCRERGIPVVMTSPDCPSGSDRVSEVARADRRRYLRQHPGRRADVDGGFLSAAACPFDGRRLRSPRSRCRVPGTEFTNPNAVKVVTALDGRALYFSRATIPFDRDGTGFSGYRKHLGIYAYRKAALERFAALPPSPLERWSGWNNCAYLRTGSLSMLPTRPRIPSGWIPRKTWRARRRC